MEYKYLMMSLILIFIVGSLTFIASSFTDVTPQDYEGYLSPIVNFVSSGYNFDITIPIPILPDLDLNFNFNPFGVFGGNFQNFISTQVLTIGLLPEFIGIPILVILISSIGFFLIKLIQGFIP